MAIKKATIHDTNTTVLVPLLIKPHEIVLVGRSPTLGSFIPRGLGTPVVFYGLNKGDLYPVPVYA